jgi:2-iminobutanoate/2-iminopropanoate deaminase
MKTELKTKVEYLSPDAMKGLPFSEAVRVGDMLYLDSSGKVVPGGIAAETRQTMENIKAALERCGSALNHVVKATVMLVDMNEWAEMNKIYVTYFPNHLPARSAMGVNWLARGARVEIEVIAVVN